MSHQALHSVMLPWLVGSIEKVVSAYKPKDGVMQQTVHDTLPSSTSNVVRCFARGAPATMLSDSPADDCNISVSSVVRR